MPRIHILAFLAAPLACWAHMAGHPVSIASGLTHPLTGIDHLLALLAVGWIAHRPHAPAEGRRFLVLFLLSMLSGAALGLGSLSSPISEYLVCISLILSGVTIVAPVRERYTAFLLVAGGLGHGYAHGAECPAGTDSALFLVGMVASSTLLLMVGRLAHRLTEEEEARFGVRLAFSTVLVLTGSVLMGRL